MGNFLLMCACGMATILWIVLRVISGVTGDVLSMCSSLVLAGYGCYHFKILLRFKEQNDKFAASNRKMKKHNVELEIEVRKLERPECTRKTLRNSGDSMRGFIN